MSHTVKKQKHTLHRSKREYSGHVKTSATGRIKCGHGALICPCCVHMRGNFTKTKVLSRRLIRRVYKITVEEI